MGTEMQDTATEIAPAGAICQVCKGVVTGEIVEAAPGPRGAIWYIHADYLVCALVAIMRVRER